MNYPRRQQYRRVRRAAAAGVLAAGLVLLAASLGAVPVAVVLLLVAVALGGYARTGASRGPQPVGARSEDQVQRALAPLQTEGWRLRHSLPWQGHGDIDSMAIAPTGIAFAIETKTSRFEAQHVARVMEMAA